MDKRIALQEMITAQPVEHQLDKSCLIPFALQEEFLLQPTVLLGGYIQLNGDCVTRGDRPERATVPHSRTDDFGHGARNF
jgi:hypothetical protein